MAFSKPQQVLKMATAPDISKLSYSELKKLMDDAQQAIDDKKEEELKVLADGYAKKLQAAGFEIVEGIEALSPYLPAARTRAPRGSAPARGAKAYVVGTVYGNPTGPETWTGGTKGQLPKWLKQLVDGLDDTAKAAAFAKLAKK
jgi:DNA-binding protein H-NS